MADLNVHRRVYPLGFQEVLQSAAYLGHRITNILNNLSHTLQVLIKKIIHFFYDRCQIKPLPQPKALPLVTPKGHVLVAPNCSKWNPREIVFEKTITKMFKNMCKAAKEHLDKAKNEEVDAYAPYLLAVPPLDAIRKRLPVEKMVFKISHAHDQGTRAKMEDASFFLDSEGSFLAGVFDGHGGKKVAEFTCLEFQARFSQTLIESEGIVHRAFEKLFYDIQQSIGEYPKWRGKGTTAVFSYVDKATNFIYTATLGDSEAKIYRKIRGDLKSIPLSVVRDWGCEKEATRAAIGLGNPNLFDVFIEEKDSKNNRVNRLNVSRALGDTARTGTKEKPLVIHKPKITINILQPGDTVLWACDGLWDKVHENEIVDQLNHEDPNLSTAKALVDYSVKIKKGNDNVSIVALQIK